MEISLSINHDFVLLRHIPSDSGGSWSETFSPEHPTDLISGEKHNECTILDLIYVVCMWNSSLDLQEVFLSSSLVNEIITAIYFSGVAPRKITTKRAVSSPRHDKLED